MLKVILEFSPIVIWPHLFYAVGAFTQKHIPERGLKISVWAGL